MTATTGSTRPAARAVPDRLTVRGGRTLAGTVAVPGFKHSLVSSVAAAAAADAPLRLRACPDIAETAVLASLLCQLGAEAVTEGDVLSLDCRGIGAAPAPARSMSTEDVSRIHGSVYLLPALLGRFGSVGIVEAGGCRIGDDVTGRRPMAHYVEVFERFGATSRESGGALTVTADRLRGTTVDMVDFMSDRALRTGPLYSGATKAALLTAAMAHGTSVVRSPYPKPDVTELVTVLRALGVPVERTTDGAYVVDGRGGPLPGPQADLVLIPDLIAVVTWICAGALLAAEPLTITAPRMADARVALAPEIGVLDAMGVRTEWDESSCVVHPARRLRPVDVLAASHGVFSDSQPLLALLAAVADGGSSVRDTVWAGRFTYAEGFAALGMDVAVNGSSMRISGPWRPQPASGPLHAQDLRAAAALLLATLAAPGTTTLTGMAHLGRGYPDLPGDLAGLGAHIETSSQ